MPDKPSRNEDEYFAKREAEKLEKLRQEGAEKRAAEEKEAQRKLHHMHCPKCGSHLHEEHYHGVKIDRCRSCHGVWLDAGEIETLLDKPESGTGHFLKDFVGLLGKKHKYS